MDLYFKQILDKNENIQQKNKFKMIIISLFNWSHFCFYGILIFVVIILNLIL